jgi:hypothetical protein
MRAFVFLGPTLPHAEARRLLAGVNVEATILPPAEQGSVYRAAEERPFAILIVDGYFERVPAVWHKEILWAIRCGVHVLGAASMGALRAAELASYGMRGVGSIYERYRSGELEDDDEVAVAHGDASTGYRPSSDAMVNIRATLLRAEESGAVSSADRRRLEQIAKGLFYPERTYAHVFQRATEEIRNVSDIRRARDFVESNRVDCKRADAVAGLQALGECCNSALPPPEPAFAFARTQAWHELVQYADSQSKLAVEDDSLAERVAEEVRLSGAYGRGFLDAALARAAAKELARIHGTSADAGDRVVEGAPSQGVEFRWMRERFQGQIARRLLEELDERGQRARYVDRARRKQRMLKKHGLLEPTLEEAGITSAELLAWYRGRVGLIGGPPTTSDALAHELGLSGAFALEREALREFLYARLSSGDEE